jgi:hypothetical protein
VVAWSQRTFAFRQGSQAGTRPFRRRATGGFGVVGGSDEVDGRVIGSSSEIGVAGIVVKYLILLNLRVLFLVSTPSP